jgi:GNAT superfamily N-acetyltransferase
MNIEIEKLTPALAEDYARFFDMTPHDVNVDEHKCYCVTWRGDDSYANGEAHWFPTREERRARAIGFVRDGSIQGYLAYSGDEIVGWCNANADCQTCVDYLRSYWPIAQYPTGVSVKSIFCFMIAPEMQRQGVATALVERVCKDAADEGFDYVEAYINKEFNESEHDFRGPPEMFKKCGFDIYAQRDGRAVARKALKKTEIQETGL